MSYNPFENLSDMKNAEIAKALRDLKATYGNGKNFEKYFVIDSPQFTAKIEKAVKAYAPVSTNEKPILLMDDTLFGTAKSGFVITDQHIFFKGMFVKKTCVPIGDITNVFCLQKSNLGYIYIETNDEKYELTTQSTLEDAQSCMNFLIDLIQYLQSANGEMAEGAFGVDVESIEQALTLLQEKELKKALKLCQGMSKITLEAGAEEICDCIVENLHYYYDCSKWIVTKNAIIDPQALESFQFYNKILSMLPLDDDYTNATEFVSVALQFEKFADWNDYHALMPERYMKKISDYEEEGRQKKSWSAAAMHFEKACVVAGTAYNAYKKSNKKGMKESANWYKLYSDRVKMILDNKNPPDWLEKDFNRATATISIVTDEYIAVLNEVERLQDDLPSSIY